MGIFFMYFPFSPAVSSWLYAVPCVAPSFYGLAQSSGGATLWAMTRHPLSIRVIVVVLTSALAASSRTGQPSPPLAIRTSASLIIGRRQQLGGAIWGISA